MTDYLLFSKILFRSINHFGYGEEKLRDHNRYNCAHNEKLERIRTHKRWLIVCDKGGNGSDNSNKNANGYRYVAQRLKNLRRTVKPPPKIVKFLHNEICICALGRKDNHFFRHTAWIFNMAISQLRTGRTLNTPTILNYFYFRRRAICASAKVFTLKSRFSVPR